MADQVESLEFRRLARANCYQYGCLYVHTDSPIALDKHEFPRYNTSDNGSAMEKFLSLMQGLGTNASGNDPLAKLPRTLPVVQWSGDSFNVSISLSGTMYFLSYRDYTDTKKKLKSMMVGQGWTVTQNGPIMSYSPTSQGSGALYADDPVDAAGMAMLTNAMQHTTAEIKVMEGLLSRDVDAYAQGKAKLAGREAAEAEGLAGFGIAQNMKAGYEAYCANSAAGIIGKWQNAGNPVNLLIDNQVSRSSVNCILTDAAFTESAFIADDNGNVYPTQMEVNISVVNLYGALLTTMTRN